MIDAKRLVRQALDPRQNVVVKACAGSGKTWLLVSRLLRLLLDGVAPGEILAITFTRKAALEMRARLDQWLHFLAVSDEDSVRKFLRERAVADSELDACLPRARQLYEQVLSAQPGITVSTFHSWFLDVLKRAPIEEGLASRELSEQTGPLEKEAWLRLGEQLSRDPDGRVATAYSRLLMQIGAFNTRKVLGRFVDERLAWQALALGKASALDAHLDELRASLPVDPATDLIEQLRADAQLIEQLRECAALFSVHSKSASYQEAARGIQEALDSSGAAFLDAVSAVFLTRNGEPRRDCPRISKALEGLLGVSGAARLMKLHGLICQRLIATLEARKFQMLYLFNADGLLCGQALLDHYQASKRERGLLDFADVEWECARLLRDSEQADYLQYKLDARYRSILLDEFQDTSPLQWQILFAWLRASRSADRLPTLFLVGDPKQSIYRFRGAESRLFDLAANWLKENGAVELANNHTRRLAPVLVEAVNQVFTPLQDRYPDFIPHEAHERDLPGRLEVLPLAPAAVKPDREERVLAFRNPLRLPRKDEEEAAREREARQLVEKLQQIEGCWVIRDPLTHLMRPARWEDVLILVRSRTHLPVYEDALKSASIPYLSPRRGGLLDTLEAADLMALLTVLSTPWNDLALARALKSPVFDISDEELEHLAHEREASLWQQLMRPELIHSANLLRAANLLKEWRSLAGQMPVHDLLDQIYDAAEVSARYAAAAPPALSESVQANLRAFMELALTTSGGRYPNLPDFLSELAEQRRGLNEEAPDEGELPEAGNALRILTVHGAKGLEAPIVWLLNAGPRKPPPDGYRVVLDWPPGEAAPSHFSLCGDKSLKGAFQQVVLERERELAQTEELNLLYVAMTRARQALIVSGSQNQSKSSAEGWQAIILGALTSDESEIETGDDLNSLSTDRLAPSSHAAPPLPLPGLDLAGPVGSLRGGSEATEFGELVHALLEQLTPPAKAPDRDTLYRNLGAPQRFDEAWERATHILRSPDLARFFNPAKYDKAHNELSYVRADGGLRRIDRVVEFADEIWVLDYKTGEESDATRLLARHRPQLEEYRQAVAQLMPGKPVFGGFITATGRLASL
ncbi:MAG: UvrD-helicase domain-containing protein [Thiobacillaceae bacterium]